jgi:aspartate-semialdehyde dehydrogenase
VASLQRIIVSTYQSVSGTGQKAIDELYQQTEALLQKTAPPESNIYPHPIGWNIFPQVETFQGDDFSAEERKMIFETHKILGQPIPVNPTCVRVPVPYTHSQSITAEFKEPLSPEECRAILEATPGVRVLDAPENGEYPTSQQSIVNDDVLVGRIRRDPTHETALNLWVVSDNLRKGAATNSFQIVECLASRGLLNT